MNKILKRNLFLMRKNYYFNIIFALISIPLWTLSENSLGSFDLTIPLMTYSSVYMLEQFEDFYKYNCILNSLPVTRYDIVKSKFQSVFMIYIANTAVTLVIHTAYSMLGVIKYLSVEMFLTGIALSFFLSMIYASAGTALIYKFGYIKTKAFFIVIMMATMFTVSIPLYIMNEKSLFVPFSAVFIILGALIYFVSQKIVMKLYIEKEF